MKQYIKLICIGASLLAMTSCDDLLKEEPKTFLSPDNFYTTPEGINAAVNAIYRTPQDRYSRSWAAPCWFEWGTDILEITDKSSWAQHNEVARLPTTFNPSSSVPLDFWKYTYNHIKDVNNLVTALPSSPVSEAQKRLVEGQVRAMRAFLYFDAVRVFGEVPLLLKSSTDVNYLKTITRAPLKDVYAAIIADLEFAIAALPQSWPAAQLGSITQGSAAAMLAHVYMTMAGWPIKETANWQKAKTVLEEFVDKKTYGNYDLLLEYADVFDDKKGPGVEGVWIVNFTRGTFGNGSLYHTEFAPLEIYYAKNLGLTYGGGWSNGLPTDRFYKSYDQQNDKRFKHTYWSSTAEIAEEYDNIVPKDENDNPVHIEFYRPHIKKFREKTPNNNSQGTSLDHNIYRYADVLLMYAEVLNELGDQNCYTHLNKVRNRAGLESLSGMSQEAFREHIKLERAWELCYEGSRKMDLVRWGDYATRTPLWNPQVVGNILKDKHEYWPIPQAERDINKNLSQNDGWQ